MEHDIQETESILSAKSIPPPVLSENDREVIRQFCAQSLQLKTSTRDLREERKKWNDKTKAKRKYLQDWIRENGKGKCFVLPRDLYHESEDALSKSGLPSIPPYLRLQRNTTDANITPAVAETAVLDVEPDNLRELAREKKPLEALVHAIVDSARNSIRTHRESIALANSLEKGTKALDIPELPKEIAKEMVEMHEAQSRSKVLGQKFKARTSDANANVKKLQPKVAEILDKAGTTSQPVKLQGGQMHRIVKTNTARSCKVNIKMFEEAVSETVQTLGLEADTIDAVIKSFMPRRKELIKRVQLKLASAPKKATTSVKLVPVKQAAQDIEEEDVEDEEMS